MVVLVMVVMVMWMVMVIAMVMAIGPDVIDGRCESSWGSRYAWQICPPNKQTLF